MKIVVVGSCSQDYFTIGDRFPKKGETLFGKDFSMSPGGKGSNQAVAAAKLGADVTFLGCVGNDDIGEAITKNMSDHSINTNYIEIYVRKYDQEFSIAKVNDNGSVTLNVAFKPPGNNVPPTASIKSFLTSISSIFFMLFFSSANKLILANLCVYGVVALVCTIYLTVVHSKLEKKEI